MKRNSSKLFFSEIEYFFLCNNSLESLILINILVQKYYIWLNITVLNHNKIIIGVTVHNYDIN